MQSCTFLRKQVNPHCPIREQPLLKNTGRIWKASSTETPSPTSVCLRVLFSTAPPCWREARSAAVIPSDWSSPTPGACLGQRPGATTRSLFHTKAGQSRKQLSHKEIQNAQGKTALSL